jgi:3-hydroxyisobutyrate dehydrogenase-like beta-hydroxyacid dehydrogenase
MARLAFLGLGQMGAPMAARLIGGGHDVAVWNRTAERAAALVEAGARQGATPAQAATGAEAVFTMLATPEALDEVLFGEEGAVKGLEDGTTLVEMSTVGPAAIDRVRERLPEGVAILDAPVLGSVPAATEGTLQLFVGGEAQLFERWRPVLERIGTPRHLGPLGSGAAMKLVVNATLGTLMAGLGEAMALADALGLDQEQALDVLAGSPIGVTTKSKRGHLAEGTYPPNFKLALARKDMELVSEAAESLDVDARLAAAARSWFDEADRAGLGPLDYSAVIAHIRHKEARLPG